MTLWKPYFPVNKFLCSFKHFTQLSLHLITSLTWFFFKMRPPILSTWNKVAPSHSSFYLEPKVSLLILLDPHFNSISFLGRQDYGKSSPPSSPHQLSVPVSIEITLNRVKCNGQFLGLFPATSSLSSRVSHFSVILGIAVWSIFLLHFLTFSPLLCSNFCRLLEVPCLLSYSLLGILSWHL